MDRKMSTPNSFRLTNRGTSLVQVTVAAAILAILTMAISDSILLMSKAQRANEIKTDTLMMRYDIARIFADPAICTCHAANKTFAPLPNGTFTQPTLDKIAYTCDAAAEDYIAADGTIAGVSSQLKVESIKIANFEDQGAGDYIGQFHVHFKQRDESTTMAPVRVNQFFTTTLEADGTTRKITSCGVAALSTDQKEAVCDLLGGNVGGGGGCIAAGTTCSADQVLAYNAAGALACTAIPTGGGSASGGSSGGGSSGGGSSGGCSGPVPSCPPGLGTAPDYCSCGWLPPHTVACTPTGWKCTSTCDHSCEGE